MAHYVLSDIHGEGERFHRMLEKIRFSREDKLYILGDVIDRGPGGIALLREIMASSNMELLLGNHEYMMTRYFAPEAAEVEIRRWNRNGNSPTLAAFLRLTPREREEILAYLQTRKPHILLELPGERFYLVHGFPGENLHDEVWGRPGLEDPNPIPDRTLIIGHTPVLLLGQDAQAQQRYEEALMRSGRLMK